MKKGLVSLFAVVCLTAAAHADEATRKATIDLVRLVLPPDQYEASMNQMQEQMLAMLAQQGASVPADGAARLKKVVKECVSYDEMLGWTADIYSARFTLGEIQDLTNFYKTATGKKLARVLPEIMGELGKKMGQIMMTRLPAAMQKYGLGPDAEKAPPPAAKSKKK